MRISGKKAKELNIVEGFLERIGLGHFDIDSGESPDFFIAFVKEGRTELLACEITQFYSDDDPDPATSGSRERRFFEIWMRIAQSLREALDKEGQGLEFAYGVLQFRQPGPKALDRVDRDKLVTELVHLSKAFFPATETVSFPHKDFPLLSKLISQVRITRNDETGILWRYSHLQSGEVNDPTRRLIQIVKAKNRSALDYAWRDSSLRWLTIYAEAKMLADHAHLTADPLISGTVAGVQFSHIYLWDKFSEDIFEIFPSFRTICNGHEQFRNLDAIPEQLKPFLVRGKSYPTRRKAS